MEVNTPVHPAQKKKAPEKERLHPCLQKKWLKVLLLALQKQFSSL